METPTDMIPADGFAVEFPDVTKSYEPTTIRAILVESAVE